MLSYSRNIIILCVLFFVILIQFGPEKIKHSMKLKTGINFIKEYPDISPEKCLKTGILNEGKTDKKLF